MRRLRMFQLLGLIVVLAMVLSACTTVQPAGAPAGDVVLLGAGPKGVAPLVFQTNGSPYRAFLEGRVQDNAYQLLMHLSNMELKLPEASS